MKRVLVCFLSFFVLLTTLSTTFAIEKADTLFIHYYRYDDNYESFNFWMWQDLPISLGGIQHNFDPTVKDEFGVYVEIDLNQYYPDATRVGIIIKRGGWEGYREIGGDRFIDLNDIEVIDGKAHAYFVEQDIRIGTSQDDLDNNIPDYRDKILSASFNTQRHIIASLTSPSNGFRVYEDDEVILQDYASGRTLDIAVTNVDLTKRYEIEVDFENHSSRQEVSLHLIYDSEEFEQAFTYEGELGAIYTRGLTTFRLWAPISSEVKLNLYHQGHPSYNHLGVESEELTPYETIEMTAIENGTWEVKVNGNLASKYYTFSVTNGEVIHEVTDPYAYSTGANGLRSMVVDFEATNPENWHKTVRPNTIRNFTDYIIWELHVRDLTTHSGWQGNENYRGRFLGLTQSGTTLTKGEDTITTGLDHIIELGVNTVQLLPIFDFGYVDEVEAYFNPDYENIFNWGYMPYHFNTLEGSYATNPFDGNVRINEFKRVVQTFHENDIRVIMDVVYNHTGESENSNFHRILPGYYHRLTHEGGFSNGSGTGNETASERSMVRKFMIDSLVFLTEEYQLSGFRFDLMSLHDIQTMNDVREALSQIDPTIIVFGEPWAGGDTLIDGSIAAGMTNTNSWDRANILELNDVGAFNDNFRDAVKGDTGGNATTPGFIQGRSNNDVIQNLRYGISGGTGYATSIDAWHGNPSKTINYVSAHDNHTLHDKLRQTNQSGSSLVAQLIQANAMVLTAQGVPFIHAGEEIGRSKPHVSGSGYDHNSYESPDSVNQLNWDRKFQYIEVFEYYKALIQIRKILPQLRLSTVEEIVDRLEFLETNRGDNAIAFKIHGRNGQPSVVAIHANRAANGITSIQLNDGKTYLQLTGAGEFDLNGIRNEELHGTLYTVASTSAIFVEKTPTTQTVATIIQDVVRIDNNSSFDPLSNITIAQGHVAYTSSHYDVNRFGSYAISVVIYDSLGNYRQSVHYVLQVSPRFNVNIVRGR